MGDKDNFEAIPKVRHLAATTKALAQAVRLEGKNYVQYEYPDYETYRKVQILGNKSKLTWQAVPERHVQALAGWLEATLGPVRFGLCHGTRRGAEQAWFRQHLTGEPEVIGTEISDTATQFPHTVQWDFHDVNPDWEQRADFVYSNSWDHAFAPRRAFEAWFGSLRPGGVMLLDHSRDQVPEAANELDPFGISFDGLTELVTETFEGRGRVLPALDFRKVNPDYRARVLVLQKHG
jgi:hypothetical protein